MNKPTIMVAVDNKENRRLLTEWLEQYYDILTLNSLNDPDAVFDLGIFDGVTLSRLAKHTQERKDAGQPVFLPILLVTTRQDVRMATHQLSHLVDEIIFIPVEKLELLARVEVLLRARQFSSDLARRNQQLQQEIDAHIVTQKALRESEARTRLLQTLTAKLATANTPEDVLELMKIPVALALGGRLGTLVMINPDGQTADILNDNASYDERLFSGRRLPLDSPLPVTQAMRSGLPVWCDTVEDCATLYAQPVSAMMAENIHAAVIFPLSVSGKVIGAASLYFAQSRSYDDEVRAMFIALMQQCAQALERARLYQEARRQGIFEERERLARELHDDVSQSLFMINILGQAIPRVWEKNQERGRELLERIVQMSKSATSEMRLLLLEMRPESLLQNNLRDLFNHLINKAQGRRPVEITCTVDFDGKLPDNIHLALYRIVQECLNNIVKHSEATSASINLSMEKNSLVLRIRDNGKGFDMRVHPAGMGLGIMRERADLIAAQMDVSSVIDQGTEVMVSLPLSPV